MSVIEKSPTQPDNFRRRRFAFPTARAAFAAFLRDRALAPGSKILLPAFIGWSPREGSGVFDPVAASGHDAAFYRINDRLRIDLDHYAEQLAGGQIGMVVLIHYFGYVDPAYRDMIRLARAAGVVILEDEAHALFTDLVTGGAGRAGDAAIFSLHKMLPFVTGGMLIVNGEEDSFGDACDGGPDPWSYDLLSIARARQANADRLDALLAPHEKTVEPLWPDRTRWDVPQTYPVLIHGVSRFALYERMNAEGFGVVALYHTMIDRITRDAFPASHRLADTVLNLPVHQDVGEGDLVALVAALVRHAAALAR